MVHTYERKGVRLKWSKEDMKNAMSEYFNIFLNIGNV